MSLEGANFFIGGKVASVHVTNILAKLRVHSRLEAAARARELGLDRPVDTAGANPTAACLAHSRVTELER